MNRPDRREPDMASWWRERRFRIGKEENNYECSSIKERRTSRCDGGLRSHGGGHGGQEEEEQ